MDNKDLIKQYVNTGVQITKQQFKYLNDNLKNSYLRSRLNMFLNTEWHGATLPEYEYVYLDDDGKKKYLDKYYLNNGEVTDNMFDNSSDDVKLFYFKLVMHYKDNLTPHQYQFIPDNLKVEYLLMKRKNSGFLDDKLLKITPDEVHNTYLEKLNKLENEQ